MLVVHGHTQISHQPRDLLWLHSRQKPTSLWHWILMTISTPRILVEQVPIGMFALQPMLQEHGQ